MRTDTWHYLHYRRRDPELYRIATDPDERRNVAAQHPGQVRRFRGLITDWVRRMQSPRERGFAN